MSESSIRSPTGSIGGLTTPQLLGGKVTNNSFVASEPGSDNTPTQLEAIQDISTMLMSVISTMDKNDTDVISRIDKLSLQITALEKELKQPR